MRRSTQAALALAAAALVGCQPIDEPTCGTGQTLLETTTRSEADGRVTLRTARSGSGGGGTLVRVEDPEGRLLSLDEAPPLEGAPPGSGVRSILLRRDEEGRLIEGFVIHLDIGGRPLASWQVALSYGDDGRPARIEAAGQPPNRSAIHDLVGALVPGPSDGELAWMLPLPGADLLGPLPADIDAIILARAPGLPLLMAGDVTPIDGGLRVDWVVGGAGFEVPLRVEHVVDGDGWTRTWVGDDVLRTASVTWRRFGEVPGDGDLVWRLDGAEFQRHTRRTEARPGGTRQSVTVHVEGRLVERRVTDTIGEAVEDRIDRDGDGLDDEIRVHLPAGEGRTLDVIDVPPFGPVDLYRFVEVEGAVRRTHTVAAGAGRQLCAVEGGPVTLEGETGARRVNGVPEGLPDPPPRAESDGGLP